MTLEESLFLERPPGPVRGIHLAIALQSASPADFVVCLYPDARCLIRG